MKRTILAVSFAMCLVLVFFVLSFAVQVQIEGVPAIATPGDTFTATVAISEVADLNAAVFEIVFDHTVLEFDSASVTGGLIGGTTISLFAVVNIENGRWRITEDIVGLGAANGSGYLCKANFTVIGSGGDSSDIDLENGSLSDTTGYSIVADWQGTHVDIDATPPTVTVKLPTGSDVAVNSDISATFSEPMNTASAESAFSISPTVSGSLSWVGNTMTFDPTANLDYGTEYTVTIAGTAEDLAGHGLDGDEDGTAEGSPTDDYSWSFTTVAAPAPDIAVSPTSKDFGDVPVGTSSSPEMFTVTNDGTADLHAGTISITDVDAGQFSIQNDTCSGQTIAPGNSATLEIVFSPTSTGTKAATLNIPSDDPDEATVTVSLNGVGAGTAAVFRVDVRGNVFADQAFFGTTFLSGSADIAEWVNVSESVEPGDVLELDPENPGKYRKARSECLSLVAGVVSTQPGFTLGGETEGSRAIMALIGIVPVKACDEGGPIELGDLLIPASIPGTVRRWDPETDGNCPFVGKALAPLAQGEGLILALLIR